MRKFGKTALPHLAQNIARFYGITCLYLDRALFHMAVKCRQAFKPSLGMVNINAVTAILVFGMNFFKVGRRFFGIGFTVTYAQDCTVQRRQNIHAFMHFSAGAHGKICPLMRLETARAASEIPDAIRLGVHINIICCPTCFTHNAIKRQQKTRWFRRISVCRP